ncbi:endonuclease/exonuclease/phosphatase family protein [Vibrio coralliilyticus]|uniref:endonuclease/exonuclease/phosphatase family protein n=1 Tax=Vibrio coralliilyticus TaxID=190893 RepID=UPI00155F9754|nr:endonuclease/exonuclease/phosphatase family protein [Vibrio coralliilyticus]NRF55240.1 endonuclease/exonuclease/phosphatase family protein [Vibrio coralliilyticus]NRG02285.1 endonuclease/exonuclease/phosphatase family protein [Vibrio coralliilyticus]
MKKKRLLILPIVAIAAVVGSFQLIFFLPKQPQLSTISQSGEDVSLRCAHASQVESIDNDGDINLLVWNIYKQNRDNWSQELTKHSDDKQLVLLQEASMTPELKEWMKQQLWFGNQVDAFKAFERSAGVLNLSKSLPKLACAYTELEPWLRLPKSAIYATYPLSDGQVLSVVNIHAVNFTYGTDEYQRQLGTLVDELSKHQGPIIVAGDFNSWSADRMAVMRSALDTLGVKEVSYRPDHRTQFITGLPLDHVFYRGLTLIKAEAPESDASDHNPLEVMFRLADDDI